MFFLANGSKLLETFGDIIGDIFNLIWITLCIPIYAFIRNGFNVFIKVAEVNILSLDEVSVIYKNVTMLITIVMVFYIAFEFVKYVINPETISDKQKGAGQIVKRVVIAILLIAFVPTIFEVAYDLQNRLIKSQIFSKVIIGQSVEDFGSYGSMFAADTFESFFTIDKELCQKKGTCKDIENAIKETTDSFATTGTSLTLARSMVTTFRESVQFYGLLALIFGIYVCYILIMYTIDVGTRYFQLIFLQLMAPVAIISNIVPQKDDMLKKWTKQCITTYVDLFIRIALLYFILLVISVLSNALENSGITVDGNGGVFSHLLVKLFLIAGLLRFAQRAPKLLKELFPNGGAAALGFGGSAKERLEDIGKSISAVRKPIAATAGALSGVRRTMRKPNSQRYNWSRGAGLGTNLKNARANAKANRNTGLGDPNAKWYNKTATYATTMAKAGFKGAQAGAKSGRFSDARLAANQSVQKDENIVNSGGTVLGSTFRGTHYQDVKTEMKTTIDDVTALSKSKDAISKSVASLKYMKNLQTFKDSTSDPNVASQLAASLKSIEKLSIKASTLDDSDPAKATLMTEIKKKVKEAYTTAGVAVPTGTGFDDIFEKGSTKWETIKVQTDAMVKDIKSLNGKTITTADGTEIAKFDLVAAGVIDTAGNVDVQKFGDAVDATETFRVRTETSSEYKEVSANASGDKK